MSRWLLALALACLCTCSAQRSEGPSPWARSVAARHAAADTALASGDRAGARRELESILATAPRSDASLGRDALRTLLQDTHYRLARLQLDDQQPRESVRVASEGLALGGDDLYVANLLVARGAALEAFGDADAALADYGRALAINERLLRETLETP